MRLLGRTVIGLALVGAALWSTGLATQAEIVVHWRLRLICQGPPGVRGSAIGDIGGTPFELRTLQLTRNGLSASSAPQSATLKYWSRGGR